MYKNYRAFIEKYVHLNDVEWAIFKSKIKVERFKKGETILYVGDVCDKLRYLNAGLARGYMLTEDGKDYTWHLYFNDKNSSMINLYTVDYESFLNQTPAKVAIEALEDCTFLTHTHEDIEFLYNHYKKGERIGRLMAEEAYSYMHNKFVEQITQDAKSRFDEFMKKTPFLLDKVPQYHIASFLHITPQYLTKMKREYETSLMT